VLLAFLLLIGGSRDAFGSRFAPSRSGYADLDLESLK
jgi:hypothetical protein